MLSNFEIQEMEEEVEMASKLSSDTCDGCKASEIVIAEMLSRLSALQKEVSEQTNNVEKWHNAADLVVQLCMPSEYRQWNDENFDAPVRSLDADDFVKVIRSLQSNHEDAKHSEILATAEAIAKTRHPDTAVPAIKPTPTAPKQRDVPVVNTTDASTNEASIRRWPSLISNQDAAQDVAPSQIEQSQFQGSEQLQDSDVPIQDEPLQPESTPTDTQASVPMAQGLDILDNLIIYLFGQGGQPTLAHYNNFCAETGIDVERLTLFIVRNGYFDFTIHGEHGILFPQVKLAGHLPRIQTHEDFQIIQGSVTLWTELGRAGKNDLYVSILGDLCDRGFIILARIGDKNGHGEFFPGVIDEQSALLCIGYGEPPYIPMIGIASRLNTIFLAAPNASIQDIPKLAGHTIYMSELDPIDWRN